MERLQAMRVETLPVYSKLAREQDTPEEVRIRIPDGWRLSEHQVATYHALKSNAEVVFNVAMTGDGKSLAGQLPAFVHSYHPTMAMYPTNELIRDQLRQSRSSLSQWKQTDLLVTYVDARKLDELEDNEELHRADALQNLWSNHELVLTNPDIFHYVMQQYYIRTGRHGDAPDRVIGALLKSFSQFTFDEFHVFQTPQVVSVLNALLFIREVTGQQSPKKFLFLSATPGELMLRSLERAELRFVQISGNYEHTRQEPDPTHWRRILHSSSLSFAPQRAEEWVEAHLDDTLLPFFLTHRPAAKGALIVNSVAAAQRLVNRLRPVFASHGLTAEPNTGFDAPQRRQASYDADLLIGTSTVDVGVDFQINFLVFESHDAGSFLQRFGRLGRHDAFKRDGVSHRFEAFEAHALLPAWLYERLFQVEDAPLRDSMEIDREHLSRVIRTAFPQTASFEHYGKLWGGLQAATVIRGLYHPTIKGQYAGAREQLAARYQQVLGVSIPQQLRRLRDLKQEYGPLVREAQSFRGGGDLSCGIIDEQETAQNQIKTYELFGLLANFELADLDKEAFIREVHRRNLPRRVYESDTIAAYYRVLGVRPERNDIQVTFNQDIDEWGPEYFGVAQVVRHIEIDAPHVPGLPRLNRGLRQRRLVALFCLRLHPAELARRLRLPWPFPLYRFCSRDGLHGSIAFGRQALLLETALQKRSDIECGGSNRPIIV
jgi:CRISPR-associated endonuclease/helicase Cas3